MHVWWSAYQDGIKIITWNYPGRSVISLKIEPRSGVPINFQEKYNTLGWMHAGYLKIQGCCLSLWSRSRRKTWLETKKILYGTSGDSFLDSESGVDQILLPKSLKKVENHIVICFDKGNHGLYEEALLVSSKESYEPHQGGLRVLHNLFWAEKTEKDWPQKCVWWSNLVMDPQNAVPYKEEISHFNQKSQKEVLKNEI